MKRIVCSLIVVGLLSVIVSCTKSNDEPSSASSIDGTWKFVSMSATTESTMSYKDPYDNSNNKVITRSAYTSTDNGGTVTFSGSTMSGTGVTYQVNTTAHGYSYVNNELEDSVTSPVTFSYPATNSNSSYKIIGKDSIYFNGQILVSDQNGTIDSSPSGGKFAIVGNTLTLTSNLLKDTIINYAGTPMSQHATGVASIILQKQ